MIDEQPRPWAIRVNSFAVLELADGRQLHIGLGEHGKRESRTRFVLLELPEAGESARLTWQLDHEARCSAQADSFKLSINGDAPVQIDLAQRVEASRKEARAALPALAQALASLGPVQELDLAGFDMPRPKDGTLAASSPEVVGCISDFAGAVGGLGAVVGGIATGTPIGAGAGVGVGAGVGAVLGTGFCVTTAILEWIFD